MTAPHLDDQPVEQLLRRALAADAEDAPRPDLPQLADSAVRLGQANRRHSAVVGAVASVVVAVTAVAGVAVVSDLKGQRGTEPPATGVSSPPAPAPSTDSGASVLMFRGVEVPVPAAMLLPGSVQCGTPLTDAAYVVDDSVPLRGCAMNPGQADLTTVVMQPVEDIPPKYREAGTRALPDGRWEITSAIPDRDVWLTVTSPDRDRAEQLFGSATIVAAPDGCAIHPGQVPLGGVGSPVLTGTLEDATTGRVCGYRAGWLTGATTLTPNQVGDLVGLIDSAPSDATIDCELGNPGEFGWWVTVGQQRAWVETTSCPRIVAETGDGSARLTSDLFSMLWRLAPGPASGNDLVDSKG